MKIFTALFCRLFQLHEPEDLRFVESKYRDSCFWSTAGITVSDAWLMVFGFDMVQQMADGILVDSLNEYKACIAILISSFCIKKSDKVFDSEESYDQPFMSYKLD